MKKFLNLAKQWRSTPVIDDDFPYLRDQFDNALYALLQSLPKIVCLCGSTRFYTQFQESNYRETMEGNIVLSVGFYPHAQNEMHGEEKGCTPEQKIALDALHFRKIDLADEVLVLNVSGYVGNSTTNEVRYALAKGKVVRWIEPNQIPAEFQNKE